MTSEKTYRFVVIRDGENLVAQCVEYDICTFASDLKTLRRRIDAQMAVEFAERGDDLQGLDPAPVEFHKMWEEAEALGERQSCYDLALAA